MSAFTGTSSAAVVLLFAGCAGLVSGSRGVHSTSWSTSTAGEPDLPGITSAEVAVGTYNGDRAVVIWSATAGGGMGNHVDPNTGDVVYSCTRSTADGTEFAITCTTPDGTTGQIDIAGQKFDLAAGRLFLIAAPADKVLVRQLKQLPPEQQTTSGIDAAQACQAQLRAFARETPEILSFFSDASATPLPAEKP